MSSSTGNVNSADFITEYKRAFFELYGNSSHIELGAQLEFLKETNNAMFLAEGIAVLSE